MSLIGFLGVVLGLMAIPFAMLQKTRSRIAIFILAYLVHITAAVIFYFYVIQQGGDAEMYYNDRLGYYEGSFTYGTTALVFFVQALKNTFGGSLFEYFLLFQAVGFWGIAALMRLIEETYLELGSPQPSYAYLLLFLPGVHFWTAAVGKDAPLFMAVGLTAWATMGLQRRIIPFLFALVIMVLIRPHIALIALIALAGSVYFQPGTRVLVKYLLLMFVFLGVVTVAGTVQSTLNVDVGNADSVADFLAVRSDVSEAAGGDASIVGASFPVKFFSLLFRPLFIDATGALGYMASVENLILLLLFLKMLLSFRLLASLIRRIFYLRFAAIFFLLLAILLAIVNYNIGLGLRQKTMLIPSIIAIIIATASVRKIRRGSASPSSGADRGRGRLPQPADELG